MALKSEALPWITEAFACAMVFLLRSSSKVILLLSKFLHLIKHMIVKMAGDFPTAYRAVFNIIDSTLTVISIVVSLPALEGVPQTESTNCVCPASTKTTMLLQLTAGWYIAGLIHQVYLLRATHVDLTAWPAIESGFAVVEIFMLAGLGQILSHEFRVSTVAWRIEHRTNIVISLVVLAVKIAFLLGMGMKDEPKGKLKSD